MRGLTGLATAIMMQVDERLRLPVVIRGKPPEHPVDVPIMFELTVLFSAITALVGMLMLMGLPHHRSDPLDLVKRFGRVTTTSSSC